MSAYQFDPMEKQYHVLQNIQEGLRQRAFESAKGPQIKFISDLREAIGQIADDHYALHGAVEMSLTDLKRYTRRLREQADAIYNHHWLPKQAIDNLYLHRLALKLERIAGTLEQEWYHV